MAKFKFKEDFVNGVLPNTNGLPNVLFKKGDIVEAEPIKGRYMNRFAIVIEVASTVAGSYHETEKIQVPTELLENITLQELEASNEKQAKVNKIKFYATWAAIFGVSAYGVYKVGQLPTAANHERLYTAGALLSGGVMMFAAVGGPSASGSGPIGKLILTAGACVGGGTVVYLAARVLAKQNIKTSVLAGTIAAAAIVGYFFYSVEKRIEKTATNSKNNLGKI